MYNGSSQKLQREPPRLLLLSGVPPGPGSVGQIILQDLCEGYPDGHICCFATPEEGFEVSPFQDRVPVRVCRPRSQSHHRPPPSHLGAMRSWASHQLSRTYIRKWVADAVEFGRQYRAEKVWMVMDNVTTMAMGSEVARRLELPLLCLVWDPPDYLLRKTGMDSFTRTRLSKLFAATLRQAQRVAVVSAKMQEDYAKYTVTEPLILRHGLDRQDHQQAAIHPLRDKDLQLGFAGSLYSQRAWRSLIEALNGIDWRLDGRHVVIRILGSDFGLKCKAPANIEYLGFRSVGETARILAECDLNYLPYPFESGLSDVAQYSFPTKLSTYLAAGRPIFIHAPGYSSLARFFRDHRIGICCKSLEPLALIESFRQLLVPQTYSAAAQRVSQVLEAEFSREVFLQTFYQFVGVRTGVGTSRARAS